MSGRWNHKMLRRSARGLIGLSFLCVLAVAAQETAAKPIKVRQVQDLGFGTLASSLAQGGTVVINATTGAKSVTGGVTDLGGTHGRAEFVVTGNKDAAFTIALPGSITITAGTGPGTATVDSFTADPASPTVLGGNGKATVFVGATLHLGANQLPENYTGTFDLIADYQ